MTTYYMRFFPDGRGRGCGTVDSADFTRRVQEDPANGYLEVDFKTYCAAAGVPDHFRFDLDRGVVAKTEVQFSVSKTPFKGDNVDYTEISWDAPRPLNLTIHGNPLDNNPHEGSMRLTWDQEQRIRIAIDDYEYFGDCEVLAL